MSQPWLSVIMPTYNGEVFLPAALNSVLAQRADQIEVIAIDDGSTDATLQILKFFASKLHLRIVQRRHIGNWAANTNYGLTLAQSEFICFLHQDDHWLDSRIPVLKPVLEHNPSATMVVHPSCFIDLAGKYVGLWGCPLPAGTVKVEPKLFVERLLVQNFIAITAPIISRTAALDVGGLDERLWYAADWDLWLKLGAMGKTVYIPQALTAFRLHRHSQTVERSADVADIQGQLLFVLAKHMKVYEATYGAKPTVRLAANFSVSVNTALASRVHGHKSNFLHLLPQLLAMGPTGWHLFIRDSRIIERISARLQVSLTCRPDTAD